MQATTPRSPLTGQGGWSCCKEKADRRFPRAALFPLSYTWSNLSCSRRERRRTAAPQTWPSSARPGCTVRGDFIPGGNRLGTSVTSRTSQPGFVVPVPVSPGGGVIHSAVDAAHRLLNGPRASADARHPLLL